VLERGSADSVKVWPPTLHYARAGDTLTLLVVGLKKGYTCAEVVTEPSWFFELDTLEHETYRIVPGFHQRPDPPGCDADPGRDTVFRRVLLTSEGTSLYLKASDSTVTDTVTYVSGPAFLHLINHVRTTDADTLTERNGFTFRDSTAGHPHRMMYTDSLPTCGILQAATFEKHGDTVAVRMLRIQASALPDSVLPSCAGPRADSIEVVPKLYPFP
jgi:hypothetical protein